MEKRQKLELKFEIVIFYEATIVEKASQRVAKVSTSKRIQEVESDINFWIKCGKYEVINLEKVERQQVRIVV
jgi:hypothetical protein